MTLWKNTIAISADVIIMDEDESMSMSIPEVDDAVELALVIVMLAIAVEVDIGMSILKIKDYYLSAVFLVARSYTERVGGSR